MSFRIGVDIGGTFTDFCLIQDDDHVVHIHKQLTTPRDPSESVLNGLDILLARLSIGTEELNAVVHGSTLVTNALIERQGAKAALVVTKGFADLLDMGFERRYDLFDLRLQFPNPLIAREHRVEVSERIFYDGSVEQELLDQDKARVLDFLRRGKFEAVAICFMHSYANDRHEREMADYLKRNLPEIYVSASSVVLPYIREYERWTTTTMNAFTQPKIDRYLNRLEAGLRERGFGGTFHIMTSSGGTITPETARMFPVRMLESGPAAGALMSAFVGESINRPDLLSFDLGGTTAKGALVENFAPAKRYEMEVARVHEFKKGSGLPVKIPTIDMIEIGSGGGSIANIDDRGMLRMGPRSAGAEPGPACYDRGGLLATLTDANLVLGYLDPAFFLGGSMLLNKEAAHKSIEVNVAKPLDIDVLQAAWGMHEVINEDVARAFRVHASERGFDYRRCSMIAFGGAGPIHGLRIARKLRIPEVVFPIGAGVMSAFGMLVSPLLFETAKTYQIPLKKLTPEEIAKGFAGLVQESAAMLEKAGVLATDVHIVQRLDMRFHGQGYEIEVERPQGLSDGEFLQLLPSLFARNYRKLFGTVLSEGELEVVNWKVEAKGPRPDILSDCKLSILERNASAEKGFRKAFFPETGAFADCPVYDRYALQPSRTIKGPALIEERESTCVIGENDIVSIDDRGNLVAQVHFADGCRGNALVAGEV